MRIRLDCGRSGREGDTPDRNVVKCLVYQPAQPLEQWEWAISERLAQPTGSASLANLALVRSSACVVICDVTGRFLMSLT